MPFLLRKIRQYECDFRFQHKHRPLSVVISLLHNNTLHVSLPIPIRSICPGQVRETLQFSLISISFYLVCSFL